MEKEQIEREILILENFFRSSFFKNLTKSCLRVRTRSRLDGSELLPREDAQTWSTSI